jgi:hypothetical protein
MRRSDAQVAGTLLGMKLPIRAVEWAVAPPPNPSRVEREATAFARQCLMEEVDFEQIVENALLMLDFGCAAHEDVWSVDGNRVRLAKAAPRLPVTFQRWLSDGDELLAIEQHGWKDGTYATATVPASKLALFTFQREGANFAGRSVLRPMYQSWYIKANLYKIDAIAQERNGMGIPVLKMAPGATVEDIRKGREWVERLTTHEKAGMVLPPEWGFSIEGMQGATRSPAESIRHHNMQISMAGLAQFMLIGSVAELERTMQDFFYTGLQATARHIARVLTLTTMKRLVDFNFSGVMRYPQLVPSRIDAFSIEQLMSALKELAAVQVIQPDYELEAFLRQRLGLPAVRRGIRNV